MLIHNKYIKWRMELGEESELCSGVLEFGKLHTDIYRITNITKLRSFQYRLLQRGLVTNTSLCKWGIKPSELCSFCKQEKETLSHLFYYCTKVQDIWARITLFLKQEYCIDTAIRNTIVQPKSHVGNFICLLVKQHIYAQKCLGTELTEQKVLYAMHTMQSIEKYIAIKMINYLYTKKVGTAI